MPSSPSSMSGADFFSSYFALFDLPESFELDDVAIKTAYRQLQRQYHPDKFASATAAERRVAEQFSGRINEAYATLSSPLRRAEYLLSLRGIERDDVETVKDAAFLQQQMFLRETLEEISSEAECADFAARVQQLFAAEAQQFVAHYVAADNAAALASVARMHFFDKLLAEIEMLEARLLDE